MSDKEDKAKKLANDILDFVNDFGYDSKTFSATICGGHRTLQQSVMRLFMTTIRAMAETSFDDRNKNAVALANAIAKIADDYPLPLI